ncbi:aminoacyl-tRNA deacylase [Tomitella fengzijianii]|uniref:Cys-tRNA(Pro)/Cys-tRNA(Cys) deacylase n=1 Tax=Tomitella fengzijianii TaxID=2597660 RepID=A0A516X544_9ACTN|nr:aminoacyl-tRNA deacylase [Tomitella fengzijianii]QDQ98189.1 aminoacyl-tRNA deacylase [Tomitella fengzijianii]
MSGTSTPATLAAARAGIEHRVHEYSHDRRVRTFGAEAVEALTAELDVAPEQIFKTLLIKVDDVLAVAVLPVPSALSLKAAAKALGGRRAAMADHAEAERATGYVVGGISPLGQRKRLPTVVDESALAYGLVLCSAGRRGLDLELRPQDLVTLTGAVTARIATN